MEVAPSSELGDMCLLRHAFQVHSAQAAVSRYLANIANTYPGHHSRQDCARPRHGTMQTQPNEVSPEAEGQMDPIVTLLIWLAQLALSETDLIKEFAELKLTLRQYIYWEKRSTGHKALPLAKAKKRKADMATQHTCFNPKTTKVLGNAVASWMTNSTGICKSVNKMFMLMLRL